MKLRNIILFVTVMVLTALFSAYSASASDNLRWSLDDNGTMTISGTGDMESYNPYDSARPPWYSRRSEIKRLVVESGVTSLSHYSFADCVNLTSIEFSDTVTALYNSTFPSCTSLTSVTIPPNIKTIEDSFQGCTNLAEINITDSTKHISTDAFNGTAYFNDSSNWTGDVLYLGNILLASKSSISGALNIKAGTTVIAENAFNGCSALTSVTFPDSLKHMGIRSFAYCTGLTSISLPPNVYVEQQSFMECTNLANINIPDTVTGVEMTVFKNTAYYNDESNWIDNVLYIDNILIESKYAISGAYTVKPGTTVIAGWAFRYQPKMTAITFPDTLKHIGWSAFTSCYGLTTITIPDSVTDMGIYAFSSCTGLTSVTLGRGLKEISTGAFDGCTLLKTIEIPDNITDIGDEAFYECTALTKVTMGNGVRTVGAQAFYNCSKLTGVYTSDLSAWVEIEFTVGSSNPLYYAEKLYLNNSLIKSLVIPDGTIEIGAFAFIYATSLTSVTIPDTVEYIGEHAFESCTALTKVTLGKGLKSLGYRAFGCNTSKIAEVHIKDIAAFAAIDFDSNTANPAYYAKKLYLNGVIVSKLVIPDGAEKIGAYAFYRNNSLTDVTIPNSVKSIGKYAFSNCTGITDVYYIGNEVQWDEITQGNSVTSTTVTINYIYTDTSALGGNFIVSPVGVSEGQTVIFACYKDDKLVSATPRIYKNEPTLSFTPGGAYDEVKVMVWGDISSIMPLSHPEIIE